ncbi:MAG: hypothetical protein WA828_03190 [Coleofasciculaceae cyanobacterium]
MRDQKNTFIYNIMADLPLDHQNDRLHSPQITAKVKRDISAICLTASIIIFPCPD